MFHFSARSMPRHALVSFLLLSMPAMTLADNRGLSKVDSSPQSLPLTQEPATTSVLSSNQPITWHVDLAGPRWERPVRMTWSIRNFHGDTVDSGSTVTNEAAYQLRYQPEKSGWYELALEAADSSGQIKTRLTRAFSAYPAVKSSGRSFHYGVCTHTATRREGADYAREIELMKALGIDIAREGLAWEMIQPTPESWNYQKFDTYIQDMTAAGIELQGILAYTPKWATTGNPQASDWNDWNKVTPRLDAYLKYVSTTVSRYKGRIGYWEIWNEPDVQFWRSSTQDYVELFNAASRTIKEANPDAQVLNGGLAMASRKPNINFQHDFVTAADRHNWDIWAYHDYQTFGDTFLRHTMRQANYTLAGATMPVWVNEGGFMCLASGGEREQARTLVKKIALAPSLGVKAYFWYDLRDDGTDPKEPEHHFGLVRHDFQPKPAFVAYQSLIAHIGQATFEGLLPHLPPGMYGTLFSNPTSANQHVLVLWQEGRDSSRPIWIGGSDKLIAIDDLMGNAVNGIPCASGSAIQLTDEPVYVRFSGRTSALQIAPMVTTPDKIILSDGQPTPLAIQLTNPGSSPLTVAMTAQATESSIQVSPQQNQLTIQPGATETWRPTAVSTGTSPIGKGQLTIQFTFNGSTGSVTTRVPLLRARTIPRCTPASDHPLAIPTGQGLRISLEGRGNIHNLYTAEPKPGMRWEGPADLSAQARVAYDDAGLLLELAAEDNVHSQHFSGSEVWQGDSLQLAISLYDGQTDYLEAQFALISDGKIDGWIDRQPSAKRGLTGKIQGQFPFDVRRNGTQTLYQIRIPWSTLSLAGPPKTGFRLNFILNDDDGAGRKQWLQLTPGIGEEKNPALFDLFQCR